MKNDKILGHVQTDLDQQGKVTVMVFHPCPFKPDSAFYETGDVTLTSQEQVQAAALRLFASYFVHLGQIETADPDLQRVKSRVTQCEKWPGTDIPRFCVVEFYLEDLT